MHRVSVTLAVALLTAVAAAQEKPSAVRVLIQTDLGDIEVEVDAVD